MSFTITEWNINPNRNWYIKLSDSGAEIDINLYPTQADAQAGTNLTASGTAPYGTASEAILAMSATGEPEISLFNQGLDYHLKVSGQNGDTTKTYQVAPFVDIPEINNNIYRSSSLISQKATQVINAHTHTSKIRDIGIANHRPGMKTGEIINLQSTFRSLDILATIDEVTIIAGPGTLINRINAVQYVDMSHYV